MIAGNLPYHLRLNKNIERQVFIDLLTRISTYGAISDYSYIGFGGPFLEDLKLLHNHFNISKMYSVEKSGQVVNRQNFNKPVSCITCMETTSEELINNFPIMGNGDPEGLESIDGKVLVWLDYTSPTEIGSQLLEFKDIIKKVTHGSIVKITVNAHHNSLLPKANLSSLPHEKLLDKDKRLMVERCKILSERLGSLLRSDITTPEFMTKNGYPKILYHTILTAAFKALEGENKIFLPLAAFKYSDGQQMLTVSGIVLKNDEEENFKNITSINSWDYYIKAKDEPLKINAPYVSASEKLHIDQLLPSSLEEIKDKIKFQFDDNLAKSNEALENYRQYYRFYPNFSKIWI